MLLHYKNRRLISKFQENMIEIPRQKIKHFAVLYVHLKKIWGREGRRQNSSGGGTDFKVKGSKRKKELEPYMAEDIGGDFLDSV